MIIPPPPPGGAPGYPSTTDVHAAALEDATKYPRRHFQTMTFDEHGHVIEPIEMSNDKGFPQPPPVQSLRGIRHHARSKRLVAVTNASIACVACGTKAPPVSLFRQVPCGHLICCKCIILHSPKLHGGIIKDHGEGVLGLMEQGSKMTKLLLSDGALCEAIKQGGYTGCHKCQDDEVERVDRMTSSDKVYVCCRSVASIVTDTNGDVEMTEDTAEPTPRVLLESMSDDEDSDLKDHSKSSQSDSSDESSECDIESACFKTFLTEHELFIHIHQTHKALRFDQPIINAEKEKQRLIRVEERRNRIEGTPAFPNSVPNAPPPPPPPIATVSALAGGMKPPPPPPPPATTAFQPLVHQPSVTSFIPVESQEVVGGWGTPMPPATSYQPTQPVPMPVHNISEVYFNPTAPVASQGGWGQPLATPSYTATAAYGGNKVMIETMSDSED